MKTQVALSAVLGALVLSSAASADLVTVRCTGTGAGRNVNVTYGTTTTSVFAGQLRLTLTNSTGQNLDGLWTSFCTELSQFIHINGTAQNYTVLPVSDLPIPGAGMGTTRANAIARMYTAAAGAQFGTNSDAAAAFQIAIWEVSMDYDGTAASLNTAAGNFKGNSLSAAITAQLTNLFAAAANTSGIGTSLVGIGNTTYQDQILDLSNGIPAPGALALLGLAGLVGARRRK
ncbi:MAG: hypothetical protein RLY21_823 [Planctomycetota bacterium]|jgi:uncharacterized protein (TIGR03382 family)